MGEERKGDEEESPQGIYSTTQHWERSVFPVVELMICRALFFSLFLPPLSSLAELTCLLRIKSPPPSAARIRPPPPAKAHTHALELTRIKANSALKVGVILTDYNMFSGRASHRAAVRGSVRCQCPCCAAIDRQKERERDGSM